MFDKWRRQAINRSNDEDEVEEEEEVGLISELKLRCFKHVPEEIILRTYTFQQGKGKRALECTRRSYLIKYVRRHSFGARVHCRGGFRFCVPTYSIPQILISFPKNRHTKS